jgi:hypothetical protein
MNIIMNKLWGSNSLIYAGLILYIIVISSDSIFSKIPNLSINGKLPLLGLVLFNFFCILILFSNKGIRVKRIYTKLVFFWLLPIAITSITNVDPSLGYIYFYVLLMSVYIFTIVCDGESFTKAYVRVILMLSVFAIITHFFYIYGLESLIERFPVYKNVNDFNIRFFGFSAILTDNYPRLWSIFREPSVAAIYICLALLLSLTRVDRKISHIVILSVAVMLTESSSGIIVLLLLWSLIPRKTVSRLIISSVIGCLAIYAITSIEFGTFVALDKFSSSSAAHGSFLARYASIVVNADIFFNNPFFGIGLGHYSEAYERIGLEYLGISLDTKGASTNTIMSQLAIYGLIGTIPLFVLLANLVKKLANNRFEYLVILVAVILLLSSQDLRNSLLFYVCLFSMTKLSQRQSIEQLGR